MDRIFISGFADEIDADFDKQLDVVEGLGMHWISLRSADGKNIADYTAEEVKEKLLPRLQAKKIRVSSLGSPIGKIDLDDDEAFYKQLAQLKELCRICNALDTEYIRIFSFYTNEQDKAECLEKAADKLKQFIQVAENFQVKLLLENEKGVFGDTAAHSKAILEKTASPYCRAAFDFANFVQCGEDPEQCWNMLRDHVSYIHIKDALYTTEKNVLCGTGDGKIKQLLRRAICEEGYQGFLTLEPHLSVFEGLQDLERGNAQDVIGDNGVANGAQGFTMQYHALENILKKLA